MSSFHERGRGLPQTHESPMVSICTVLYNKELVKDGACKLSTLIQKDNGHINSLESQSATDLTITGQRKAATSSLSIAIERSELRSMEQYVIDSLPPNKLVARAPSCKK